MDHVWKMEEEDMEDAGDSATLTLKSDNTFHMEVNSYAMEGIDMNDDLTFRGTYTSTATELTLTTENYDRNYSCQQWGSKKTRQEKFTQKAVKLVMQFRQDGGKLVPVKPIQIPGCGITLREFKKV